MRISQSGSRAPQLPRAARTVRGGSLLAAGLVGLALSAGCSNESPQLPFPGRFNVLASEPQSGQRLFLNDPISFDFSTAVALASADLDTVSFSVLDLNGNPVAEQPTGHFELATRPGDDAVGRRLVFVPTLPTNDSYDNGGFRPARQYLVRLVGGDRHNDTVLRDTAGNGLDNAQTFRFTTADGTTPAQLFRNLKTGGPRKVGFSVTPPAEANGVALNKLGSPNIELRLEFDQPLNPHGTNVPVALDTDPVARARADKGRVFLQYREQSPTGASDIWLPAEVDIETNDIDHSTILLRPIGLLPNNATIEVVVLSSLEDISGESNVGNTAHRPVFATFRTQPAYEPQFDVLVEQFATDTAIDREAAFVEPEAEIGPGFVRAGFEFEGSTTQLEYEPSDRAPVLNTDFTQVEPSNGLPFNVSGGVFNFRRVHIRSGVTVRGTGTRPMVWLVGGDFIVDGTLTVSGSEGARVNTLNSANFPTAGGVGACGGGHGGKGSPISTARSQTGQAGFGPGQKAGLGGGPGNFSCTICGTGSGGGGGSLATQGDPFYRAAPTTVPGSGQQVDGFGGQGCTGVSGAPSRILAGGLPGPRPFKDGRDENDFWGAGVDLHRQVRIRGELATPIAGAGGGGGGDNTIGACGESAQFVNDNKGGGGGAGGGILVVKALGRIRVNGQIEANGGHGGGGEPAGSCRQGGGGGGGSGGMIVLMSAVGIDILAKGSVSPTGQTVYLYSENEYRFAISADGGVCKTSGFSPPDPNIEQKYRRAGSTVGPAIERAAYDARPTGGFGGMGIVQLMAPPGPDDADGTGTVLDDNINYLLPATTGAALPTAGDVKKRLLAWRGFPSGGELVDDGGDATNIGNDEGDIRPSPILLPVPFNSITRVRSKWLDLGRGAIRRELSGSDGQPRGVVGRAGPEVVFGGVNFDPAAPERANTGYAKLRPTGLTARVDYAAMLATPAAVLSARPGASFRGAATHRIDLRDQVLGAVTDRYVGYEAEVLNASGSALGGFRILTHTAGSLTVAASDGLLPAGIASVQVRAKFFKVVTDGGEGLGQIYTVGERTLPIASVRIGFAFHQNPDPDVQGAERYPAAGFAYDLSQSDVVEHIRAAGMRFVQWDVQFNAHYQEALGDPNPRPFGPRSPRPELRFLRLPFRF